MKDCLPLAIKLLPLYVYILLGYIAGKKLQAQPETISRLMFYIISPIIIFNGVLNTHLDTRVMTLPLLTFFIASFLCIVFYRISRRIWTDSSKNIMAFSAGSGATGYFGIPLAMMIFSPQTEGIYIMSLLGVTLYDNSVGYFVTAKGTYSAKECLSKLIILPSLYAFVAGLALNLGQVSMPEVYHQFVSHIKGVYVVLGMMIIGLGLSTLNKFKWDAKFIGMTFLAKFLIWPLIILAFIVLDQEFFGLYHREVHQALILLSIVPLAVNMVILATIMKCDSEKAAATVLLSTLFALFYVPIMAVCLIFD